MARWMRPTTRRRIYERDGWTCAHCGEWLGEERYDERMRTLDHVTTREEFRRLGLPIDNSPKNLVLACLPCNSARGMKPLSRLSLTVQARIAQRISRPLPTAAA